VPFSEKYLFHHIVKAGGTSLGRLFERILGPTNVFHASGQYLYTPPTILAEYLMVTGHFRFTRGPFHDRSRLYLTFLRDPLDRILSAYYYYRSRPDDVTAEQVLLAKQHTFEEFIDLQHPSIRVLVDNHQTCSFGLADPRTYGLTGRGLFRAAVEVLESYDFVGVYEYFPQSVAALCRQMGWSASKRIPHLNQTPERARVQDLSRATRDKLLALSGMDYELYQYFKARFTSWCPLENQTDSAKESGTPQPAPPYSLSNVMSARRPASFPPGGLGTREVEILSVGIAGESSGSGAVKAGEWARIDLSFQAHVASEDVNYSICFWDQVGQVAFSYKSGVTEGASKVVPDGIYTASFRMKMNLGMGLYTVDIALHRGLEYQDYCYHYLANSGQIEVEGDANGWFCGHSWLESEMAVTQVGPIDYALASMEVLSKPTRLRAGATVTYQVKVNNSGSTPWPSSGPMLVCCCYHIVDTKGDTVIWDGERSVLPGDVAPGEHAQVPVAVTLPEHAGNYILRLTLLQEGAAWFDEQGAASVDLPMVVRPASTPHREAAKA
jgi:hypothetical protein